MAQALCLATCPTATAPTQFYQCNPVTRRGEYKHLIFVKCEYQFTDITDTAEWTTAIGNGDVVISPPGNVTLPTPTQDNVQINCDEQVSVNLVYELQWSSYETTTGNVNDIEWYDDICESVGLWRVMYTDCNPGDERFYMQRDWADAVNGGGTQVVGTNPGFKFYFTQIPHQGQGEGQLAQWTMVLQYKALDNKMTKAALLPAVAATFTA